MFNGIVILRLVGRDRLGRSVVSTIIIMSTHVTFGPARVIASVVDISVLNFTYKLHPALRFLIG